MLKAQESRTLLKTSEGKKGTSLLIIKEDSSDKELVQDGHYESERIQDSMVLYM